MNPDRTDSDVDTFIVTPGMADEPDDDDDTVPEPTVPSPPDALP